MLISENIRSTTSEVFSTFKDNWRLGKNKKDKLVYNLVAANKMKQAEIIYILKTRAEHLTEQEKR